MLRGDILMEIELFGYLPKEARAIRTKVFMEEQGFTYEYDEIDDTAWHLVASEGGKPAATCRFFWSEEKDAYVLGRLAVLPEYRGKNVGAAMMEEAEARVRALGGNKLCLHAQCRASGFYEKQGYQKTGAVELEEGCPHIWMSKTWE